MGRERNIVKQAFLEKWTRSLAQKYPAAFPAAKWGARALLAGMGAAYGLHRLAQPDEPQVKQAAKNKAIEHKKSTREQVRSYEHFRKLKHLSSLGLLGSMGLAGYGAAAKKMVPLSMGLAGTFGSSLLHGRSSREEKHALNQIKRYFDLREQTPPAQVVPIRMEKRAVTGSAFELAKGNPIPLLLDVATLPIIGKGTANLTRAIGHAAVKNLTGANLTARDRILLGLGQASQAIVQDAARSKTPVLSGLAKLFIGTSFSPTASGLTMGEEAGKILREVSKISPKYKELVMEAIRSDAGVEALKAAAKADIQNFTKAGRILEGSVLGRFLKMRGAPGGANMLGRYAENSALAIEDAAKYTKLEDAIVRGVQGAAGAGAVGGAGHMVGRHRSKHPLAKDELPSEILKSALRSRNK